MASNPNRYQKYDRRHFETKKLGLAKLMAQKLSKMAVSQLQGYLLANYQDL